MKNKSLPSRLVVYIIGLFIMALGSNLSVLSGLGVSPINSIPYAISLVSGVSLGSCVTIVFSFYVLLQALILGRSFQPVQVLQIVFVWLFGRFVNLTATIMAFLVPSGYIHSLVLLAISVVLIALGVSLYMSARLINLPAEGLAAAIASKLPKASFHNVKMTVDCSFIVIAVLICMVCLGKLSGIREGTLLAAVLVGKLIPVTGKWVEWANRCSCKTEVTV